MIKEEIQKQIKEGMLAGEKFKVNTLKTILGEIQAKEMKSGKDLKEEEVESIIRKFKEGAEETIQFVNGSDENEFILQEIDIYNSFIPKTLTVDEIIKALEGITEIFEVNNDGQAMGIAMQDLKSKGLKVLGKDVKEAVARIRI
jgi:uncharacterized protein YqeY